MWSHYGLFGALLVFRCHIKGMIRLRLEQVWMCSMTRHHHLLLYPSFHSWCLSWRVVWICSAVWFLEHFGNCEMEWTQESAIELIELYKRKEIIWDPKHPCILAKLESKMHGRYWEKKWTDLSKSAKKKMENLLSSLWWEKMKMRKTVEQEKVSAFNWTIYVLWQCLYFIMTWNNCILHAVRHTHYMPVKNNQVNESLSTYFKENTFLSTDFYKYLFLFEALSSCNDMNIQN